MEFLGGGGILYVSLLGEGTWRVEVLDGRGTSSVCDSSASSKTTSSSSEFTWTSRWDFLQHLVH